MKNLRVNKFIKSLLTVALVSTLFVSCGKDNTTGKKSSNNSGVFGAGAFGNGSLPSNYMNTLMQENQCAQGGQRTTVQLQLNQQVSAGLYAGVTSFGDIAVIQNAGGGGRATLYICPRAGLQGGQTNGQLLENPIITNSVTCPIGQISRMNMILQGQTQYQAIFRPIDAQGSSLCQNQGF
jgi:hypothetical protein